MQSGHSAGQYLFAPPLTREQDLSTASGTLVDEDEEDYKTPAISSLAISVEDPFRPDEGNFSNDYIVHIHNRRSCSNTRRTTACPRSESKARSHSRHGLAKFRPTAPQYHARRKVEKSEGPHTLFNVYTAGIKELSEALSDGSLTSVQVLDTYLAQIDRHNDTLRAIVHLAPREQLYRLARQRDFESKLGRCRGPLHGIPIVVK
jgi:hypothetical protein